MHYRVTMDRSLYNAIVKLYYTRQGVSGKIYISDACVSLRTAAHRIRNARLIGGTCTLSRVLYPKQSINTRGRCVQSLVRLDNSVYYVLKHRAISSMIAYSVRASNLIKESIASRSEDGKLCSITEIQKTT